MFTIFGLNLFKQAYSAHYQEGKDLLLFLEYYVYNPLCMTRNEASELVAQQ